MLQLDLLSYTPTPEEVLAPATISKRYPQGVANPPAPVNQNAIAWHQAKAALYLRFIGNIMRGDRLPAHVKRYEISRLHELRQQALARVKELEGS